MTKTKSRTKSRKIVRKPSIKVRKIVDSVAPSRIPLAALPPVAPVVAPIVKATQLRQDRGNRAWFQMAKDDAGVIEARILALRAKAGYATMNDMAAAMFEALCEKYGV